MKPFYWILALAIFLDAVVLPWLVGQTYYPKLVLAVLPFAFLFLSGRDSKIFFILVLIYFRTVAGFNLGLLFLALLALMFFEQWFLSNFFHKTAWQTMVFSGGGIALFYIVLFSLESILLGDRLWSWGGLYEIISTVGLSVALNFFFLRIYHRAQ